MLKNGLSGESQKPLPIPALLGDQDPSPNKAEFFLTAQQSTKEFIEGKMTPTYGYNGDFLGPVIRVKRGNDVTVHVENKLQEQTTVHWHGLEVDGEFDGGPHTAINEGDIWSPNFKIDQPAATLWFHPHLLHETGEQVYKGLAGLFYIEDDVSEKLPLPNEYGVNDIPLIIQDRKFTSDGEMNYDLGMHDVMMGLQGTAILVNGAINPFLEVPKGKVRLRILNGSNARVYNFHLSTQDDFWQIASDGGLLEKPVQLNNVVLGAAERAEIIVDFSEYDQGDTLFLNEENNNLLEFRINGEENNFDIPNQLTDIERISPDSATNTRKFVFQGMGLMVNINGKQMDIDRIDEKLLKNTTEIWEVSNDSGMGMMGMDGGGMAHPFHAHGVQFQILDRNGQEPPENERGWKDTFLVYPNETVRAIATFDHEGIFMYHCHILEHEDAGMMGQFQVN
ncbi:multicopper oxidase domain-containing protein [Bacillus carboniphilus]|uniref:Multicopper oxidase domain-containing protein n=1 Tax=Bacillus carboniphilus TaxID=86663 RepID=A0ABN0WAB4_9BACI